MFLFSHIVLFYMTISLPKDWDNRRKDVYERDNYTCANCEANGNQPSVQLHAHHIVPRQKGGSHKLSNLKTLCSRCHLAIHSDLQAPTKTEPISYDEYIAKVTKMPENWTKEDQKLFDKTWEMASKKAKENELPDRYLPSISSCKKSCPIASMSKSELRNMAEYELNKKTDKKRWDEQRHELLTTMS